MVTWRRLLVGGLLLSATAFLTGRGLEAWRLGGSEQAAFERVERGVRARFDEMSASLRATGASLAADDALIEPLRQGVTGDQDAVRSLFEIVRAAVDDEGPADLAVTVYGPNATARAWSGRPSEIPRERILGGSALFVAPGPLGPRLIHLEPVVDDSGPPTAAGLPRRLGSVAAERPLSPAPSVGDPAVNSLLLPTSIAPVSLRTAADGAADTPPFSFRLLAPSGEPLLAASVARSDLEQTRKGWRRSVLGTVLAVLALTVLLMAGPLLDWRAQARSRRDYLQALGALVAVVLLARVLLWLAIPPSTSTTFGPVLRSPVDLLLTGLLLVALVALAVHASGRWRLASQRARRAYDRDTRATRLFVLHQLVAGAVVALVLVAYEQFLLADTVERSTVDVLHLALQPWNSARLASIMGLLFFHTATVWVSVAILVRSLARWRAPRHDARPTILALAAWAFSIIIIIALSPTGASETEVSWLPILLVATGCIGAAFIVRRRSAWYRHASQVSRVLVAFLALLFPALVFYPSLLHHADRAKRRLVEQEYATQALNHPEQLRLRWLQSLQQIDRTPGLNDMVASLEDAAGPPETDRAFLIWRQTDLAEFRLTSAVELYGPDRSLVSRFALDVPEYTVTTQAWQGSGCNWEVFGVAELLGSQERQLLHAERGLCETASEARDATSREPQLLGAIVVRAMLDYEALPFISSESPYFELLRADPLPTQEGALGRDVDLVMYGWGLSATFASSGDVWPIDEELFRRLYHDASRQAFWTSRAKGGVLHHVYFVNDRAGIYALGYPALGPFDHLVHLAEIVTLVFVTFVLLVLSEALFGRLSRGRPMPDGLCCARSGRASISSSSSPSWRRPSSRCWRSPS